MRLDDFKVLIHCKSFMSYSELWTFTAICTPRPILPNTL
jgi:hypothetical protein